jgi:hypothetical protein
MQVAGTRTVLEKITNGFAFSVATTTKEEVVVFIWYGEK